MKNMNFVSIKYRDPVSGQFREIPGLKGDSAYEIAVENGFVGTEAEWLESLKGSGTVLSDTIEGWNSKAQEISVKDTIYVYTNYQIVDGKNVPGLKIGDGTTTINELPFIDEIYAQHIENTEIHLSSADRIKLANSVMIDLNATQETLIFEK